jgi:hypothetical protein
MSTLVYPQLSTGALSQYPVRKTRRVRTVVNQAADGSTFRLADPAGEITEWQLEYAEISDDEAAALEQFFTAAEGSLQGFTFLDPSANLLASSDALNTASWQADPLLMVTSGAADPAGGTLAWQLNNGGAAGQTIGQTLQVPGAYTYCFSVYARATAPRTVRLSIGDLAADRVVTESWGRIVFGAAGPAGGESLRFAIEVPPSTAIEVYGPQVEAQGGASVYRASTRGGVYDGAHFRDDVFRVTRTGCNRNSCTVNIIHANHL